MKCRACIQCCCVLKCALSPRQRSARRTGPVRRCGRSRHSLDGHALRRPEESRRAGALARARVCVCHAHFLSTYVTSQATIAFSTPSMLLLDEPSNHLDLDSVEALSLALTEFTGGVLLVRECV
jgi:hypothetical protein